MRIFQQQLLILGIICVTIVLLTKFGLEIPINIKSQKICTETPFLSKRVEEWCKIHELPYTVLSFFFGPVASLALVNSRLFLSDIFLMGLPHSMIINFVSDIYWKLLFFQRFPELAIQIVYLTLHSPDHYVLFAMINTVMTVSLLSMMKYQSFLFYDEISKYRIQDTAFLMEISSEEVISKSKQLLLQRNAFKDIIAEILELRRWQIELPLFEEIELSKQCECNNKRVPKCYGLKLYIAVNSMAISRRVVLMKLQEARSDNTLSKMLMHFWQLSTEPDVDDIEILYNFEGDLVIPRAQRQKRTYSVVPMTINLQQKRLILESPRARSNSITMSELR